MSHTNQKRVSIVAEGIDDGMNLAFSPAGEPLRRSHAAAGTDDFARLRAALLSDDPFLRSAAVTVLSPPEYRDQVIAATKASEPQVRLGVAGSQAVQ